MDRIKIAKSLMRIARMMIAKDVFWYGQTKCDMCQNDIHGYLYDGATIMGPWATMCKTCFRRYGRGTGLGKGQEYVEVEPGKFQQSKGGSAGNAKLKPYSK